MSEFYLPDRLAKLVEVNVSGLDILHGELKNYMYEAQQELIEAENIEKENDYDDALESMERKYWEGMLNAYAHIYKLTYDLSFAIAEKDNQNDK